MKKLTGFLFAAILFISLALISVPEAEAYQRVRGYTRSNGTYVQPYYRSYSNSTRWDNFSTRGNYNPFTGSRGYRSPW